jgi:flagellar hook assembly protein FlgD
MLSFDVKVNVSADLYIYNIKGQRVRDLLKKQILTPGSSIYWDGKDNTGNRVVSGIYFYDIIIENRSESGRLVIIK